jgi:hypothetical protein
MLGLFCGKSCSTEVGLPSPDSTKSQLTVYREHLLRRHDRPSCPICRSQFEDYDAIDTHLRTMICQKVEGEQRGDCMTPDVARKIRRRTKKGETLTEGWQRMYSIMFPGDKTIPSPCEYHASCFPQNRRLTMLADVEDIGQLYTERVRKSVTDEFIQHLHSKLNSLSMRGVSNNPSAIKAACVSHLTKVADQYIRGGSNTDEESTVAMAQNLCSHSTWPTAWHPYKKQSSALSSGLLGFDVFGNPVGDGPIPHWQGATVPAFPSCNCRHAEHVSSINPSANWTDYTSHIASHIPNLVHFSDSTDFDNALYVSSSYELSSNAQSTCTWE